MSSSFPASIERGGVAVGPSVLSADFSRLAHEIAAVEAAGADFHHLDVMDGHFVPNITFGPLVVESIAACATRPLVTHLMISDPARYVERFIEAGSSFVSFHLEACAAADAEAIIGLIKGQGCRAGLALSPGTTLEGARRLLERIDMLVLMTVNPGFGGQSFMHEVLPKIEQAAALKASAGYRYLIEVDGGINVETASLVRRSGGECLVAGTAVYRSGDYAAAIAALRGAEGAGGREIR